MGLIRLSVAWLVVVSAFGCSYHVDEFKPSTDGATSPTDSTMGEDADAQGDADLETGADADDAAGDAESDSTAEDTGGCDAGSARCDGVCVSLQADPHCGTCTTNCAAAGLKCTKVGPDYKCKP